MSGGAELSSRQKMINMMYLVLMAMLALNVSVDVLNAFWSISQTINKTTSQIESKNKILYQGLAEKYNNNPVKYKKVYDSAMEIKKQADEFHILLEKYKIDLLIGAGILEPGATAPPEEVPNAAALQSTSAAGEYFFPGGFMEQGKGKEFEDAMNKYRTTVLGHVKNESIRTQIEQDFFTGKIPNVSGADETWISHNFGHYPLAAAIAFLSQYQARIRAAETDVVTDMVSQLSENVALIPNTIQAIVMPEATTVMQGAPFRAKVMLAAYDNTQEPKVFLSGGVSVPVQSGMGMVNIATSSIGEKKYNGYIRIKTDSGDLKDYPFEGAYDVTAPNAVVAATKMNILYRGLDNPVSASIPGLAGGNVILSGDGVKSLGSGEYIIDPANVKGSIAKYTVSGKMPDGSLKKFGEFEYRIKNVPQPQGQIRGQNSLQINKSTLVRNKINVAYPDFEFDIKTQVTGFSIKIPGKPAYQVNGDSFSPQVATAIEGAAPNTEVIIRDIKYKILNYSKIIPKEPIQVVVTLL